MILSFCNGGSWYHKASCVCASKSVCFQLASTCVAKMQMTLTGSNNMHPNWVTNCACFVFIKNTHHVYDGWWCCYLSPFIMPQYFFVRRCALFIVFILFFVYLKYENTKYYISPLMEKNKLIKNRKFIYTLHT